MCTLCPTHTKLTTLGKLMNHGRRFHSAFNQKERGGKERGEKMKKKKYLQRKVNGVGSDFIWNNYIHIKYSETYS